MSKKDKRSFWIGFLIGVIIWLLYFFIAVVKAEARPADLTPGEWHALISPRPVQVCEWVPASDVVVEPVTVEETVNPFGDEAAQQFASEFVAEHIPAPAPVNDWSSVELQGFGGVMWTIPDVVDVNGIQCELVGIYDDRPEAAFNGWFYIIEPGCESFVKAVTESNRPPEFPAQYCRYNLGVYQYLHGPADFVSQASNPWLPCSR